MSFEDLRRQRDHHLSSRKSTDSYSNIRRTRSDTDVALQSLRKKVEVMSLCFFTFNFKLDNGIYFTHHSVCVCVCVCVRVCVYMYVCDIVTYSRQYEVERQ